MQNVSSFYVACLLGLCCFCNVDVSAAQPALPPGVLPAGVTFPHQVRSNPPTAIESDSALTIASVMEVDAPDQEVGTTVLRPETPDSARVFEPVPPVWVDQPTMKGVRAYEALFDARKPNAASDEETASGSAPEVTAEACPAIDTHDLDAPESYDRDATLLPPGQVAYFFSKQDSLVRCAVYRWDEISQLTGPEFIRLMQKGGIDADAVLATYDVMFEEVVRSVKRRLGDPNLLDPTPTQSKEGSHSYLRRARWQTNDVMIDLRLAISRVGGHLTVVQYWN
ncbi:hypothetical protein CRI94_12320 [Longibacter salinarum]|uniref:Uncharacterized protein n=1 Tax=Longibacter salinarum TaxID=1850348 RepID=A0A2A8CVS9_9BACT|nr:hypothetical protein [Longibacter salinarum]PEN12792.1 hypothetical protein CRI94_12320 [Longibacter salinarum]